MEIVDENEEKWKSKEEIEENWKKIMKCKGKMTPKKLRSLFVFFFYFSSLGSH